MTGASFTAKSTGILRWPGGEGRCALGRSGVTRAEAKYEGDGASPLGEWPMRRVYWRPDRLAQPATALPVEAITRETGWCDEPTDPFYNRPVRRPYPASHEHLWREDNLYDVLVELGYNDDPVIPGKGSAIFLHLARLDYAPTEGCVACALEDMLALLAVARPGDPLAIVV